MSDRFRVGELLAAVGAVALTLLLFFGHWVGGSLPLDTPGLVYGGSPGANAQLSGATLQVTGDVWHLGWFVVLVLAAAAISGLVFLFRVATAKNTERPMLQGPLVFTFALLAFIVLGFDRLLFNATLTLPLNAAQQAAFPNGAPTIDATLTTAGWLGVLSLVLMLVGSWIAFTDERTDTAAAKAGTEALLRDVVPRPAPPLAGVAVAPDPSEGLDALSDSTSPSSDGGTA